MNLSQLMIDNLSARVGSLTSQVVYLESKLKIAEAKIKELEQQKQPKTGQAEEGE